jgi:hypothetical protein
MVGIKPGFQMLAGITIFLVTVFAAVQQSIWTLMDYRD